MPTPSNSRRASTSSVTSTSSITGSIANLFRRRSSQTGHAKPEVKDQSPARVPTTASKSPVIFNPTYVPPAGEPKYEELLAKYAKKKARVLRVPDEDDDDSFDMSNIAD